jgi:hypothetical protein
MQIVFEFETPHGKFCDALYFEDDAIPDEAAIEAMKQERLDNWIAVITAPPPVQTSKYQRDENGNLVLDENGDPILTGV